MIGVWDVCDVGVVVIEEWFFEYVDIVIEIVDCYGIEVMFFWDCV